MILIDGKQHAADLRKELKEEVSNLIKSLDGYVEWQSGEVFSKWEKK